MISAIIVLGSLTLAVVFTLGWLLSAEMRGWLEYPKHRFQNAVRRYDHQANDARN